jgi:predicted  nucleic acid-binding Zn-ribbon protein
MGSSKLIMVLLAIALGASLLKVRELNHDYDLLSQTDQDTQARMQILESQLLKEHMKEQTALMSQQTALDQIQDKIKLQKDIVQAAEERVHREQNAGTAGTQVPALRDKLTTEKQVIDDLEVRLKDVQSRQGVLKNQDHYYQEQAGLTQKVTDDQLKAQIAEQEQILKTMNDQMKQIRKYNPYDPLGQNANAQELQAKIDVQKSTVQQLKDQRTQSTLQWGYQKAQTRGQTAQDVSDLKNTENQLQAQLSSEKAAYQSMDKDIQSGVQSRKSQTALIQSAQTDLQNQKAKLADLQSQLDAEQNRLKDLASP